jgi:hypothetical protein
MLKYFHTVMVGCLLLSGVSVSFAGDSSISSKFSKLENTENISVRSWHSIMTPRVKTACYTAGKEKKIKYPFMLLEMCDKGFPQDDKRFTIEENINDCMKKCDDQVNKGDRCIGLDWKERQRQKYLISHITPYHLLLTVNRIMPKETEQQVTLIYL